MNKQKQRNRQSQAEKYEKFLEPQEWTQRFFQYIENEKMQSSHTLRNYRQALGEVSVFFQGKQWDQLEYKDFRNYLFYLSKQDQLKGASMRLRFSALRSFYKYLQKFEIYEGNPVHTLKLPSTEKRLPKFLSEEQVTRFLEAPLELMKSEKDTQAKAWRYLRDAAILEFLYSTGLRISELVNAEEKDLDQNPPMIRVLGKGKKERLVPVGEYAMAALQKYRNTLPAHLHTGLLFIGPSGKKITPRAVQMMFKKYLAYAGLDPEITPHKLRHTFATHMLDHGADLRSVQEMLGHASLTATQIYTQVTTDRLKKSYEKSHPRAT
ncbi:MAG: site-specific tyrosine recombinase/integron integrase [Verrucomicrobiota bacterium]